MLNRNHLCYSTRECRPAQRAGLIQDLAHTYFNLDVDLGDTPIETMFADIQVFKGDVATRIDVNTSRSVVQRTQVQARACVTDNLMIYWIQGGGSVFHNGLGQEFRAAMGAVVVGSQDAVYRATAADGQPWGFKALSVPPQLMPRSQTCIRDRGYQVVSTHLPIQRVLSAWLVALLDEMEAMDGAECIVALLALDHLLAKALTGNDACQDGIEQTMALQRYKSAKTFLRCNLHRPELTPAQVADKLCLSERQLHRAFRACNTSVAAELKRLRTEQALYMLREFAARSVSDIAYQCGFDTLSTFYRCIKSATGASASEFRLGEAPPTQPSQRASAKPCA
jgi:AraC-like DNA-binding protein